MSKKVGSMAKVIFKGGFHNSAAITINVKKDVDMQPYKNSTSEWCDYLSENQLKKLENHFCGIKGCTCGSWTNSNFELIEKKVGNV